MPTQHEAMTSDQNSDTPETDALWRAWLAEPHAKTVMMLARRLERERNQARAELAAAQAEAAKYIGLWDDATKELETLKFGSEAAAEAKQLAREIIDGIH